MISKVLLTHRKPSPAGAPPAWTGEGISVLGPLRRAVFTY
jgi:hypothetical protein